MSGHVSGPESLCLWLIPLPVGMDLFGCEAMQRNLFICCLGEIKEINLVLTLTVCKFMVVIYDRTALSNLCGLCSSCVSKSQQTTVIYVL